MKKNFLKGDISETCNNIIAYFISTLNYCFVLSLFIVLLKKGTDKATKIMLIPFIFIVGMFFLRILIVLTLEIIKLIIYLYCKKTDNYQKLILIEKTNIFLDKIDNISVGIYIFGFISFFVCILIIQLKGW